MIEFDRFVITGSHEHFGSRPLTEQLLLLIERIPDGDRVLLQDELQLNHLLCRDLLWQLYLFCSEPPSVLFVLVNTDRQKLSYERVNLS